MEGYVCERVNFLPTETTHVSLGHTLIHSHINTIHPKPGQTYRLQKCGQICKEKLKRGFDMKPSCPVVLASGWKRCHDIVRWIITECCGPPNTKCPNLEIAEDWYCWELRGVDTGPMVPMTCSVIWRSLRHSLSTAWMGLFLYHPTIPPPQRISFPGPRSGHHN